MGLLSKEVYKLEVIGLVQHNLYSSWFTDLQIVNVSTYSLFCSNKDSALALLNLKIWAPWTVPYMYVPLKYHCTVYLFIEFRMCLLPRLVSTWYEDALLWLFFFFQASPIIMGARQVVIEMKRTTTRGKFKSVLSLKVLDVEFT